MYCPLSINASWMRCRCLSFPSIELYFGCIRNIAKVGIHCAETTSERNDLGLNDQQQSSARLQVRFQLKRSPGRRLDMSLGWKKFSFFEQAELDQLVLPEDLTCGAAGPDNGLFVGAATGSLSILEPSLAPRTSFQAHQHTVLQLSYLEVSARDPYWGQGLTATALGSDTTARADISDFLSCTRCNGCVCVSPCHLTTRHRPKIQHALHGGSLVPGHLEDACPSSRSELLQPNIAVAWPSHVSGSLPVAFWALHCSMHEGCVGEACVQSSGKEDIGHLGSGGCIAHVGNAQGLALQPQGQS